MKSILRKTVFTVIICAAILSFMFTTPIINLLGIQPVTERWYFIPGQYLAIFFVALGIGLRLFWPAPKTPEAEHADRVTLSQKLLSTILFFLTIPILVGAMRYVWTTSEKDISLYLLETLFAWIGLLLTIVMVSVWRKRSRAAGKDAPSAGDAPKP